MRVLVLGGGESRDLHLPDDADVVDMEKIDPDESDLPGWYRPNPGLARDLAFVAFSTVGRPNTGPADHQLPLGACPHSAPRRRPTSAATTPVYCLTPLHHQSGLLVSLGGAVVGGARIALSRGLVSDRFVQEIRQYGVTVVSYTWAMLREVIDDPSFVLSGNHPVRLFIGSGMPTGLWKRVVDDLRACSRRRVLRHHRRSGRAGQCVRSEDRQQGQGRCPAAVRSNSRRTTPKTT
jgi:putative long chain acyl-CoA synthase